MKVDPDREVKSRKEHRCFVCGLRIRKGAMYWQRKVYPNDSDEPPNIMKMHAVCRDASSGWDKMNWESFMDDYGEFRRYDLGLPLIGGHTELGPPPGKPRMTRSELRGQQGSISQIMFMP